MRVIWEINLKIKKELVLSPNRRYRKLKSALQNLDRVNRCFKVFNFSLELVHLKWYAFFKNLEYYISKGVYTWELSFRDNQEFAKLNLIYLKIVIRHFGVKTRPRRTLTKNNNIIKFIYCKQVNSSLVCTSQANVNVLSNFIYWHRFSASYFSL